MRRFVITGPSLGIIKQKGLNLILKLECPVVVVEAPRLMILLPSRARNMIISNTLLPMLSCDETLGRLEEVVMEPRCPLVRATTAEA